MKKPIIFTLVAVVLVVLAIFIYRYIGRERALSVPTMTPVLDMTEEDYVRMYGETPAETEKTIKKSFDVRKTVNGNNYFASDLYSKLKDKDSNLFYSPFSISTILAMTYAGARGDTDIQMAKVLHFELGQGELHSVYAGVIKTLEDSAQKSGYKLTIANALWVQSDYNLREEFADVARSNYDSEVNKLNFKDATLEEGNRSAINRWVEDKTNDKIKNIIGPGVLNTETRLVLTNAIYFYSDWVSKFKKSDTGDGQFVLISGERINVPTMRQTSEFKYVENDHFQMLEMPYVGNNISMIIVLPKKVDGIGGLEGIMDCSNLCAWSHSSYFAKQKVSIFIPKFKMEAEFKLRGILEDLGMTDAFDSMKADFSGITDDSKGLFISDVIHKAFVDVSEEGTEAAAATAAVMETRSIERTSVFRADHPFMFFIIDNKSGCVLFMGRVMDPR